jgi:NTE family protein
MQHITNTPDGHRSLEKRRIAVALQGGGSHGSFTWGVLDRLLEEPRLEIVGITGTSAGAMNAGILADGLRCGGAARARVALRQYWEDVGHLPGYGSLWRLTSHRNWHLDNNPAYLWAGMLTHVWSPYQLNPSN